MKIERTKNASRNILWGVTEKIITLGLPFVMRTVMIYTLGELYLGLNGLFTSVLQVLNLSELGISGAIIYSMYRPLANGDDDEVCALLNLYKKCYRIIGGIVLCIGLALLPFLRNLIAGDVPPDINIYVLYLMNLGSTVLSYELFAYRTSLLIANQRQDVVSKVSMAIMVVQFVLQTGVLVILRNYYFYIACVIAGTIANNIVAAIMCKKMYPQFVCKGNVPKNTIKDIKTRVSGLIFQKIGGIVLSSVDTLVISAFLGLRILAIYQNYYYIITALFGILGIIMSSLIATVGNSMAVESVEKNYRDFKKLNFLYLWVVSAFTACLCGMYQPFMNIWVGTELMLPDYMVFLFVVYFFVHKWCDMLYVYQDAAGIWWETRFVPFIAAVTNLVINITLVQIIGLSGILLSTIFSVIFIYDIGYAVVLFKVYFKSQKAFKKFVMKQILYFLSATVGITIAMLICKLISIAPFGQLIANGVICVIVPNIIFALIWHRTPEFRDASQLAKRVLVPVMKKLNR